jgi:hypothetical protein
MTRQMQAHGKFVGRGNYKKRNILVICLEYSKAVHYSQVLKINTKYINFTTK